MLMTKSGPYDSSFKSIYSDDHSSTRTQTRQKQLNRRLIALQQYAHVFFAVVTQAKQHCYDIIFCAASKCRIWVALFFKLPQQFTVLLLYTFYTYPPPPIPLKRLDNRLIFQEKVSFLASTTKNQLCFESSLAGTTKNELRFESVNRLNNHYTMHCLENESCFHYLCPQVKKRIESFIGIKNKVLSGQALRKKNLKRKKISQLAYQFVMPFYDKVNQKIVIV